MLVDIESGPAKVIASGSVISFGKEPIVINLDNIKYIFAFEDELDDKGNPKEEFRFKQDLLDKRTLKTTFINYNNPLGIGTIEPRNIGKINNNNIYINYIVYANLVRKSKLFQYTFYEVSLNNCEESKNE